MPITETIKKGQIKRKTGESSVEILRPETEAEIVIYDNTDSRLTSTDVQGALDELTDSNNLGASKIGYDNTDSGLTATNVQAAINEIVSSGVGVIGVKGNAEQSYRTGQVNLTPANLGIALDTFASGDNASNKDRIEVGTDRINVVTTDTAQTISGVKTFTSTNTNFTKDIRFYPGTTGTGVPYFSVGLDTNTDFIIGGNSSNISALGTMYLGAKGNGYNYISVKPTMAGWDHHIEFQDGAYNGALPGAGIGYVKYKFPTYDKVESDSTPTYTIATTADIPEVAITGVTDGLFDLNIDANKNLSVSAYSSKGAGHFDTGSTNPSNTNRLNYDGYLYATKLYSGGSEVLTAHKNEYGKISDGTTTTTANAVQDTITFAGDGANGAITAAVSGDTVTYSHKTYDTQTAGLYKIGRDATGHVVIGDSFTLPTVNNGTLTVQVEGTQKGTFTANQSGNTTINLLASDFGLDAALKFIGISTTDPTSASGATVSGHTTWKKGEVVLYQRSGETGYEEYVAIANDNAHWEILGDADSYALKTTTITASDGLTYTGGTLAQNTVIKHSELNTSGAQSTAKVWKQTLDKYGHVLSATAATYSDVGAAASSHTHGNITNDGKITSTAVSSATGILVYDSSNVIQRATAANARSIIGAADDSDVVHKGTSSETGVNEDIYGQKTFKGYLVANNLFMAQQGVMLSTFESISKTNDHSIQFNFNQYAQQATSETLTFPRKTGTVATLDDIPDVDDFVTGPSSASIGDIATYNNANGKVIKDSGWQIDGDHLYHNSNSIIISNGDTPFGGENYIGLQTLNLASLYIGRESDENTDTAVYAGSDASMDLGYKNASATRRFRDLYLSRNLTDGTNSVTIANIAKDDNVIHKGTSLSYAPAENRYGNLTIYGTDGQGLTSLIVNKDAVSAGSPGSMIPMRASKFVIQDEGNAWLSDKATYDATKIIFRKNNSGTFTAYNLAFPSKSGTLAITDDCVNKVISGLNAAATPANIESTISGRTITLGDSGITAGTYSAIQVNAKGIAIAGGQILDVIAHGATPNVINGGWYFEEFATA